MTSFPEWDGFFNGPVRQALDPDLTHQEITSAFKYFCLSYHDHWLSESEAASRPMFYPQFIESGRLTDYLNFEAKFSEFLVKAFKNKLVLIAAEDFDWHRPFSLMPLNTATEQSILLQTVSALREGTPWFFVLPEQKSLMIVGDDLTWYVYHFEPFDWDLEKLARSCKIPILYN